MDMRDNDHFWAVSRNTKDILEKRRICLDIKRCQDGSLFQYDCTFVRDLSQDKKFQEDQNGLKE